MTVTGEVTYLSSQGRVELLPASAAGLPGPDQVRVRSRWVGFCGTDREIVRGDMGRSPAGADRLVIGHEMAGVVVEVGRDVATVKPGKLVSALVRSGCGHCTSCSAGRADYCLTGECLEYGIAGLDGFARPEVVLPAEMLVAVPDHLGVLAVLAEPLSIVVKALEEAAFVCSRIPYRGGVGRAVVAGAGPIGLLASYLLRSRGHAVTTVDTRDGSSRSATIARSAGATYVQLPREHQASAVAALGPADLVVEATGDALLAFELLQALGPAGVLVWVGCSASERWGEVDVGRALQSAIANHHAVIATVNASRQHVEEAVVALETLARAPGFADIITAILPPERFDEALRSHPDEIKQVVEFPSPEFSGTFVA